MDDDSQIESKLQPFPTKCLICSRGAAFEDYQRFQSSRVLTMKGTPKPSKAVGFVFKLKQRGSWMSNPVTSMKSLVISKIDTVLDMRADTDI